MGKLFNRAAMTVSVAPGVGPAVLATAKSSAYCTFAEAGVANGDIVSYFIDDGNNFEIGVGAYTSSGTTMSRDIVRLSKIAGVAGTTKVTLTSAAIVYLSPAKEDFYTLPNLLWLKGRNFANTADLNMFRVNSQNYTQFENPIFYDNGLGFNDRHALLAIERHITTAPTDIFPNIWSLAQGRGDNTNFVGVAGADLRAYDNADINGSTKGVLYGLQIVVSPLIARNNSPFDDVTGINMVNVGTVKATDAFYVGEGAGSSIVGPHWDAAFLCGADATYAFRSTAAHDYGLDFVSNSPATFAQAAIRIPNNTMFVARNNAGAADVLLAKLTTGDVLGLCPNGFGYTAGAGGTVTQLTSKSTGVTLSKVSGAITMSGVALAAATIVSFTLTNTLIAVGDVLALNHVSGGTVGAYTLNAQCAAGSAQINVRNNTAGSLSDAIVIQFVLIKGANA